MVWQEKSGCPYVNNEPTAGGKHWCKLQRRQDVIPMTATSECTVKRYQRLSACLLRVRGCSGTVGKQADVVTLVKDRLHIDRRRCPGSRAAYPRPFEGA